MHCGSGSSSVLREATASGVRVRAGQKRDDSIPHSTFHSSRECLLVESLGRRPELGHTSAVVNSPVKATYDLDVN
ncbi:hypothetical protein KIPB_009048 [Kipferlia bialata]|uniref:Uncharacterized protein n=1 Tax=Kipferlia bialata TaxID=797122 RepID=A0A9K3D4G1_9EUKA|nr:hypothetical protein KIPB_009048 [Kipferlia bialata]|eukprot:g9048.t1